MTVRIILAAGCLISFIISLSLVSSSPSLITLSDADMFHFEPLGRMAGTVGYGHLVFDYNVTEFLDEVDHACSHIRMLWTGKIPKTASQKRRAKIAAALSAECQLFLLDVHEYRQIWFLPRGATSSYSVFSGQSQRPRRQLFILGALAGAGIASIFSALFSGGYLAELSSRVDANTGTTISILQKDEVRLTTIEHSEKLLNSSILMLARAEEGMRSDIGLNGALTVTLAAFGTRLSEFRRVFGCLRALTDNKISPQLFNVTVLPVVLHKLQNKLRSREYRLGLDQIPDLFKCQASYVAFENGEIRIFLHIPAYRKDTLMQVYRFLPIPFDLPETQGHEYFTMSRPQRNVLAVSEDEADFKLLSDATWASCTHFLGVAYCPNSNLYRKGSAASCLLAVYKKDVTEIHRRCRFSLSPSTDFALEVSDHSIILYHAKLTEIRLDCFLPRRTEKTSFQGLRRVTVPPACRLNGHHFLFDSAVDLYLKPTVVVTSYFNISTLIQGTDLPASDMLSIYKMLAKVGSADGLTIDNIAKKYDAVKHQHLMNWGFGSISTIALLVGAVAVIMIIARYFKKKKKNQSGGVNLSVALNPLLTAAATPDFDNAGPPEPTTTSAPPLVASSSSSQRRERQRADE